LKFPPATVGPCRNHGNRRRRNRDAGVGPEHDHSGGNWDMSVVLTERARILRVHRRISNQPENPSKIMGFLFPVTKGMTVLDALLWVKEHKAQGLAFRYSCRMGICGSCGILINGEPELACETQITALSGDAIEVAPLPNFPVVRDLVTEFQGFFSHHRWVMPYLIRRNPVETGERELLKRRRKNYDTISLRCVSCVACVTPRVR